MRCAPSPGFIVPRLQAAAMNEAARLVEEGVATPEDIDKAVRAGFGPRYTAMGLCEFIDYGGLDILYYASRSMAKALDAPRYEPPALIRKLMEEGKRGAREGEGPVRLARARPGGIPEGSARQVRGALPSSRPAAAAALGRRRARQSAGAPPRSSLPAIIALRAATAQVTPFTRITKSDEMSG